MVCRTHKYADGGKIVKDHMAEENPPVKARAEPYLLGTGMAAKAGEQIKTRKSKIDQALEDAGT